MRLDLAKRDRLSRILCQLSLSLFVTACCKTRADVVAVIGNGSPLGERVPGHLIWVCPGKEVTLGWGVSADVKSAVINTIGSVSIPTGTRVVVPTASTTYTIQAKGDCDASGSADINIVEPNKTNSASLGTLQVGLPSSPGGVLWEAKALPQFWDPDIIVTSVALSAPTTISGWRVYKTDLDGAVHDFAITNLAHSPPPPPMPVAGTWQLVPLNGMEVDPRALPMPSMVLTLKCK